MSQHNYEDLAKLALFVCQDPSKPPAQWIYAVDDAWLHNGVDKLPALFDLKKINGGVTQSAPVTIEKAKTFYYTEPASRDKATTHGLSGGVSAPLDGRNHSDKIPAETLLNFIADRPDQNYGICFCTFEYFWEMAKVINQRQNAVFFDIRHQLMETDTNADLKSKWEEKLRSTKIFQTPNVESLGIQIYFAFKLNLHPSAGDCRINPNHLLILSSNLFGNEDMKRTPVLKSFSDIQKTIWDKAAKAHEKAGAERPDDGPSHLAKLLEYEPTRFTFFPIPKQETGGLFKTALAIFHNSFRTAASIDAKLDALWHDMGVAWKGYDWGHFKSNNGEYEHRSAELHSFSWLFGDDDEKQASLRGIYHAVWKEEKASAISVRTFAEFLKWHCEPDSVKFVPFNEKNGRVTRISLPTCPGVFFGLGLVHFLRNLAAPKDGETRQKPEVTWKEDADVVTMEISLGANGGVEEFKQKFFSGKQGGSTRALNELVNAQLAGLSFSFNNVKIGDIPGNGKTIRDQLISQTGVRRSKTFPAFENNLIKFSFYIPS